MRSISEFIQEQDNITSNDYSGMDGVVQAYTECAIASKLATAYCESAVYAQFAVENGFHVYQEENIFKAAGEGIKKAWRNFIAWIKRMIATIKGKFNDKKVEKAAKLLGAIDDNAEVPVNKVIPALKLFAIITVAPGMLDKAADDALDCVEAAQNGGKPDLQPIVATTTALKMLNSGKKDAAVKALGGLFDKLMEIEAEAGETVKASEIKEIVKQVNDKTFKKSIEEFDKTLKNIENFSTGQVGMLNTMADVSQTKDASPENKQIVADVLAKFTDFSAQFTAVYQKYESDFVKNYDSMLAEFAKQSKLSDDYKLKTETESFYFV